MNEKKTLVQPKNLWWESTSVYQIYPRSFKDSNGDGIGDIPGIIDKLDYIKNLGVETIWISPFYVSPQQDFGYDIADYRNIASEYGTMEDCELLISEIHNRGMKILFDLVLNHTSDQHPWFIESKKGKNNPKRDWYIWRDGKKPGGKAPPNNWKAKIGPKGWHYDSITDQWYWSAFLHFQPDLNYRNPEVKTEMLNTVRFWLEKGVDGFRLDIIDALYEDELLQNNPFMLTLFGSEKKEGFLFQNTKFTNHHPDTIAFAKELRNVLEEYQNPPRYLVGEVDGPLHRIREYCGSTTNDGLHTVFLFSARDIPLKADAIRKIIQSYENHFSDPFIPTWVYSNHDIIRRITSLGNKIKKAKLQAAFQLSVRGIPYIYYGEEIGIHQADIPFEKSKDAVSSLFQKYPKFIKKLIQKLTKEAVHRDNCRTPMQWNGDENSGFCSPGKKSWLPVSSNYVQNNVEMEQRDPNSLLKCYQRFLGTRKRYPSLNRGKITLIEIQNLPRNVLGYYRQLQEETCLVLLNFNAKKVTLMPFEIPHNAEFLVSTNCYSVMNQRGLSRQIGSFEGVIFHLME